ncbi:hypothetical protein BS78_03G083500 [Paspalum vaginatum]|nr:hypothetical protein BS78_03G083500 [Paspalum vaginatum]
MLGLLFFAAGLDVDLKLKNHMCIAIHVCFFSGCFLPRFKQPLLCLSMLKLVQALEGEVPHAGPAARTCVALFPSLLAGVGEMSCRPLYYIPPRFCSYHQRVHLLCGFWISLPSPHPTCGSCALPGGFAFLRDLAELCCQVSRLLSFCC